MTIKPPKRVAQAARSAASALSLKERFERFMSLGDFAENIDVLTIANHVPGRRKADYLARSRSVIIEQKSIDRDVDSKVRRFLASLLATTDRWTATRLHLPV